MSSHTAPMPSPPLSSAMGLFGAFSLGPVKPASCASSDLLASPVNGFGASRALKKNQPTLISPLMTKGTSSRAGREDEVGADRSEGVIYLNGLTRETGKKCFELLVVGCGGGPLETNLSSYLLKPYGRRWKDGCTALEGGSGLGALSNLVESAPESFSDFGIQDLLTSGEGTVGREGGGKAAGRIWGYVNAYTISHAHLDHVLGLVTSSGASLSPRPLYASYRTIGNLNRIFDGGVWPRLVGWDGEGDGRGMALRFREIKFPPAPAPPPQQLPLSPGLTFTALPVSHGMDPSCFHKKTTAHDHAECYDSTAFFYREDDSGEEKEILFFGDVEPDSISKRPLNLAVWKRAAPKIAAGKLGTIFLECSYPTSQPTAQLWGHLSPPYVMEELLVLAPLVVAARIANGMRESEAIVRPLSGVTVVIIHVKDDILSLPPPSTPLKATPTISISSDSPATPSPTRLSPLTLSPPVPTAPTRRASGGGAPNVGWGFSRRLSLAPSSLNWNNTGRRMSLPGVVGWAAGPWTVGALESMTELSEGGSSRGGSLRTSPVLQQSPRPDVPEIQATSPEIAQQQEEEETEEETVQERIERELNELEERVRTGIRFLIALQGMRIAF